MHKGSTNYLIGTLIAKPALLYSLGATINTSIQLFLVYIGVVAVAPMSPETLPTFIESVVMIYIPILPPLEPGDILNFLINVTFGGLLAMWWTIKWSEGMSR